jgi:hypothetical protein
VRGWLVYRGLIFLPYILSIPVVGTTFVYLLGLNGIVNTLIRSLGLGFLAQDWLGSATWVVPSISLVIIYREMGFGVVLFLARLMSLEHEILEAAEIDGANWFQKHFFVTLPQLAGVIGFYRRRADHHVILGVRLCIYHDGRGTGVCFDSDGILYLEACLCLPFAGHRFCTGSRPAGGDHRLDRLAAPSPSPVAGGGLMKTPRYRPSGRNWLFSIPNQIVLIFVSLIAIYPVYYMVVTAFKTRQNWLHDQFGLPNPITWQNL